MTDTADVEIAETAPAMRPAFKAFGADMTCRGFQYEVGRTYEMDGKPALCDRGFHVCEYPLHIFQHGYSPTARFAEVFYGGETDADRTKIACTTITIGVEITLGDLISRAVKVTMAMADKLMQRATSGPRSTAATSGYGSTAATSGDGSTAATSGYDSTAATSGYGSTAATSGYGSTAATSGPRSTAATSGYGSTAATTGPRSTAATSGDGSTAATSGPRSTAATSGDVSTARAIGPDSAAMASGRDGKAAASEGSALFLVERDDDWSIAGVWAGIAGRDGIKPDTFYKLCGGKPVECRDN